MDAIAPDPLTTRRLQGTEDALLPVNQFFQAFYNTPITETRNMEGREHTGQVKTSDRQKREDQFRKGELAALFSYSNQFDHPLLNRHLIRAWLNQLASSHLTEKVQADE